MLHCKAPSGDFVVNYPLEKRASRPGSIPSSQVVEVMEGNGASDVCMEEYSQKLMCRYDCPLYFLAKLMFGHCLDI